MTTPPELSEKDFIQEGFRKNPFPFWMWLALLTIFVSLLWGGASSYYNKLSTFIQKSPFLQVTNRELSLFLWQNPEFMRVNAKEKNGYLLGFQYQNKVGVEPANADQHAVAPPEVLFRYHTWKRLLGDVYFSRTIPIEEFKEFLTQAAEWQPSFWKKAPPEYVKLVNGMPTLKIRNLELLPTEILPQTVRLAFQGWKNYFKEGTAINQVKPTFAEMKRFIDKYPNYARNYWRNIVHSTHPDYLRAFTFDKHDSSAIISGEELSPFLKVAIYNFLISQKEHETSN